MNKNPKKMTKRVALEAVLKQFLNTQDLDQAIEDIETIFNYKDVIKYE